MASLKWLSCHTLAGLVLISLIIHQASCRPSNEPENQHNQTEVSEPRSKNTIIGANTTKTKPRLDSNGKPLLDNSIQMVASQLLQTSTLATSSPFTLAEVEESSPKAENTNQKQNNKNKAVTEKYHYDVVENSHAGEAVPVELDDIMIQSFDFNVSRDTTTSQDGISTWILLSTPTTTSVPEISTIKNKPQSETKKPIRNKPDKVNNKPKKTTKRPIIAPAGGSAINENVFNKIKETVMNNLQKHSNATKHQTLSKTTQKPTPPITTTLITKKDFTTTIKPQKLNMPVVSVTEKPKTKKKNKNKTKNTTVSLDKVASALLPAEPKEQEIELEVSTPAASTKRPKNTSTKRKKNKNKKRKPSPSKNTGSKISATKVSNSTKTNKPSTKNALTAQIYNYLSREVMPSMGVGIVGLAGLVGLASFFLYPFTGPVRRAYTIEKKNDIYHNNAEEYASEGNGQAEEEMLSTVLAGIPAKSKRINPYSAQTPYRQQNKIEVEQHVKYRQNALQNEVVNTTPRVPQDKTGFAHNFDYSQPMAYNIYQNERVSNDYGTHESMFPQISPSKPISYNDELSNGVYRLPELKKSSYEPLYSYEGQAYGETTKNPNSHPSTSMYLGSDNEVKQSDNLNYSADQDETRTDNQFVVGNVPQELAPSVTPAVVPEHGPRNMQRKKRGIIETLEEVLRATKMDQIDNEINFEIDEALGQPHLMKKTQKQSSASITSKSEYSDTSDIVDKSALTGEVVDHNESVLKINSASEPGKISSSHKKSYSSSPKSSQKNNGKLESKKHSLALSGDIFSVSSEQSSESQKNIGQMLENVTTKTKDIVYVNNITPTPYDFFSILSVTTTKFDKSDPAETKSRESIKPVKPEESISTHSEKSDFLKEDDINDKTVQINKGSSSTSSEESDGRSTSQKYSGEDSKYIFSSSMEQSGIKSHRKRESSESNEKTKNQILENVSTKPREVMFVNNITPPPSDFLSSQSLTTSKIIEDNREIAQKITPNEINLKQDQTTTTIEGTTTENVKTSTSSLPVLESGPHNNDTLWTPLYQEKNKFLGIIKQLVEYKLNLALELFQATSRGISSYFHEIDASLHDSSTPKQ